MALKFRLYASGDDLDGGWATGLAERAGDIRPATKQILHLMLQAERERFAESGTRGGKPWPEKTDETKEREARDKRAKHGEQIDKPERFTDYLMRTLTEEGKSKDAVRTAGKHSAVLGTKVFYAAFQGKERILIRATPSDNRRYQTILVDYLLGGDTGA